MKAVDLYINPCETIARTTTTTATANDLQQQQQLWDPNNHRTTKITKTTWGTGRGLR